MEGTELQVVLAVPAGDRWQLVGSAGLWINTGNRSADGGYSSAPVICLYHTFHSS